MARETRAMATAAKRAKAARGMAMATKRARARAARGTAAVTRVAGDKEGNGKGGWVDGDGIEEGDGDGGNTANGYGEEGVGVRWRQQWHCGWGWHKAHARPNDQNTREYVVECGIHVQHMAGTGYVEWGLHFFVSTQEGKGK
jgi:hypothetical protein